MLNCTTSSIERILRVKLIRLIGGKLMGSYGDSLLGIKAIHAELIIYKLVLPYIVDVGTKFD